MKDTSATIAFLGDVYLSDNPRATLSPQVAKRLREADITHLSAGKNLQEAAEPRIIDVGGIRVGLLAYSWERVQTTCATDQDFGCAPLDAGLLPGFSTGSTSGSGVGSAWERSGAACSC
ncbi:MAG: CapA family protein [Planctomycetota bacterium]|jgi:hypothetical protein